MSEELLKFDWNEAKTLRKEIAVFLKEKYKFILLRETSDKIDESHNFIELFAVKSNEKPVFQKLSGAGELKNLIQEIDSLARNMEQSLGDILDEYEGKIKFELFETIEMIYSLIQKFIKRFNSRVKSFTLNDINTVDEMQENLYQLLRKLLAESLIDKIFPAIYEGMKIGNTDFYELVLTPINNFLALLGIYTIEIRENQKIDYDICSPVQAEENKTSDYKLKDIIKEVRQLTYIFDNDHIVSEGKVVVWRFINE